MWASTLNIDWKTSFEKKLFFCLGEYAEYGFDQQRLIWYDRRQTYHINLCWSNPHILRWIWVWSTKVDMVCFSPSGIRCLAHVSSVSPSSEQTLYEGEVEVCFDEGLTLAIETLAKHLCWSNPYAGTYTEVLHRRAWNTTTLSFKLRLTLFGLGGGGGREGRKVPSPISTFENFLSNPTKCGHFY